MRICFVLPPFFFNPDSQGYNEMLASELMATCKPYVSTYVDNEYPHIEADIYIMCVQYREDILSSWMKTCIYQCKQYGGIVMVAGKASSVEYEYVLTQCCADFVFLGEPEETLFDIISLSSLSITNLKTIAGLAFKENSNVKYKYRKATKMLDEYNMPQYEYLKEGKSKYPICVMETCRSCHGKCRFCEGFLYRKQTLRDEYRVKSPDRVVEEIERVVRTYNYRIFSFSDDNFFADGNYGIERAEKIAKLLIEKKVRIRFTIEGRADDISYDTIALLKKAGLYKVFIGIESGSQSVLDRYRKGTTVEQNHNAIKVLNDLHVLCHPGHILFDPFTTREELEDTVSFFLPYLNNLFSFNEGYDSRVLFFPHGCEMLQLYWPNESKKFYDDVCYNGIHFSFRNQDVEHIYKRFNECLHDTTKYSNCTLLERRIYCLKDALSI